jgi:ferritin
MMISETMSARLNQQVKEEFYSYWIYIAMSFAFEGMGFRGFAKWYLLQAEEEKKHAMKIAAYLIEQGARVRLTALDTPKVDFKSVVEIAQETLDHEVLITKMIHDLVELATKENDYATVSFLDWFVNEQVEEVSTSQRLLDMVKMAGDKVQLLMLESRIFELRSGS